MATAEKKLLSVEELESQMGIELPNRDTPATAVISCLAVCVGNIQIKDIDVGVAANICANVGVVAQALTTLSGQAVELKCDVRGGGVNQN